MKQLSIDPEGSLDPSLGAFGLTYGVSVAGLRGHFARARPLPGWELPGANRPEAWSSELLPGDLQWLRLRGPCGMVFDINLLLGQVGGFGLVDGGVARLWDAHGLGTTYGRIHTDARARGWAWAAMDGMPWFSRRRAAGPSMRLVLDWGAVGLRVPAKEGTHYDEDAFVSQAEQVPVVGIWLRHGALDDATGTVPAHWTLASAKRRLS